jgi:hypothetical protein
MREALSAAATGEMPAMAAVGDGATEPLPSGGDTAVMTTPETAPGPPLERPPRWWLPWLVIAVILAALIVLGFLLFDGTEPRRAAGDGPGQTEAPAETTPPEETETANPVGDAYEALLAVLADGVTAGEVSPKANEEIRKDADEALAAYGEGDGEKAAQEVTEANAKTLEALEKGEITSEERGAAIQSALQEFATTMGVTISEPEVSDEGDGDGEEGRGQGPPEGAPGGDRGEGGDD